MKYPRIVIPVFVCYIFIVSAGFVSSETLQATVDKGNAGPEMTLKDRLMEHRALNADHLSEENVYQLVKRHDDMKYKQLRRLITKHTRKLESLHYEIDSPPNDQNDNTYKNEDEMEYHRKRLLMFQRALDDLESETEEDVEKRYSDMYEHLNRINGVEYLDFDTK